MEGANVGLGVGNHVAVLLQPTSVAPATNNDSAHPVAEKAKPATVARVAGSLAFTSSGLFAKA